MVRRAAQAGLILLLAVLLLGLGEFNPAQAHARLVRSDPPDNAILAAAPEQVQLWFSEAITPQLSSARLLDLNGRQVEGVSIRTDPAQAAWMAVELPALGEGVYSLNWKVFSGVDGHYNQGVLVFGVGEGADLGAAAAGGEQGEQPAPWEVASRWLNYLGLAALIGALGVFRLRLTSDDLRSPLMPHTLSPHASSAVIQRRLAGWMALCAGLAWLAGWGLLAGQLQDAPSLEALFGTRWAGLWIARQAALLLAVGLALWLRAGLQPKAQEGEEETDPNIRANSRNSRPSSFRPLFAALLLLSLVAVAAQALNSHAAGAAGDPLLPLLADGLHLVSIGLWAGGVLALLVLAVLRPRLLGAGLVRRFTPRAIVYVGLTFASGLFSSAQQVASLDALLFTPYGQALLVKVGLVLAVGVFGLINMRIADKEIRNRQENEPAEAVDRLRAQKENPRTALRFIAIEGALMLAVLGVTALLTSAAPANTIEYRLAGALQPELLSQPVDDLLVSISVRPNRPGQNILSLRANSTRRPAPAEIQRVILRLRYLEQDLGQVTLEAEAVAGSSGQYQVGGSAFSLPGRWEVEVVVRRKGLLDSTARFTWLVYPLGELPPVRVAGFPLAWLALPAAGLVLLGVGIILRRLKPAD